MLALRRVKCLFRNSLLSSRYVGIRNLSVNVDDNVSGITDEQKQVGFSTILQQPFYQRAFSCNIRCTVLAQFCFGQLIQT